MATISTDTSLLMSEHEDIRDTVTFGGSATYTYGTIFARDTTSNKYVPFVKGGTTNGNGVPAAILLEKSINRGTAGDLVGVLLLTAGKVRKDKLIIAADGNASNIDSGVLALLRDQNIHAVAVLDHAVANNF